MVKDHTDSERGNPLLPHGLLFPISSKGSFICIIPQTGWHIPQALLHQSLHQINTAVNWDTPETPKHEPLFTRLFNFLTDTHQQVEINKNYVDLLFLVWFIPRFAVVYINCFDIECFKYP